MWTANFIQIKTIQVGGSYLGQCKMTFWFGLIIHKFLMIHSKRLMVEGQQQRSDSNSNPTAAYSHKLLTVSSLSFRKLTFSTLIKIKLTLLCVRELL